MDIDFVILWVDGNDPEWRSQFRLASIAENADASEIRYRDWRNLHYWFRSVERYAPWVRRIHFVTWGHLPEWLNATHPRLHVVNHLDFIPAEYLQTFNSNTIELNINRIEGLAEHFVLFNDDMFLTRPCRPEDFFRDGLPCDMARLSIISTSSIGHLIYNNMQLINERYTKRSVMRRHWRKWFSLRYGLGNVMKTVSLMPWSFFAGLTDTHMPQPYLRSRFDEAWEIWGERMRETCRHRIRNLSDVSEWLIRYDTLVRGDFAPRNMSDCRLMTISDYTMEDICNDICRQRYRMVCLNDSEQIADFDRSCERLCAAFDKILPDKSTYEI